MGRAFNGSTTYINAGGVNDFPWPWATGTGGGFWTICGWLKIDSPLTSGSRVLWGNGFPAASQKGWMIYYIGGSGEQRIRFKAHATTSSTIVTTAAPANSMSVAGQWYFWAVRGQGFNNGTPVLFTIDSTTSNGTVTNSQSGTGGSLPGTNAFRMGIDPVATATTCLAGSQAELAIYNRTLTNAELEGIRKFTAMEVQGTRPEHYYPMIGREAHEPDTRGRLDGTLVNAPALATHPHPNRFRRYHRLFGG